MQSKLNGNVTYRMLQMLAEKAWDEGDHQRLMSLSQAVDQACIRLLAAQKEAKKAG